MDTAHATSPVGCRMCSAIMAVIVPMVGDTIGQAGALWGCSFCCAGPQRVIHWVLVITFLIMNSSNLVLILGQASPDPSLCVFICNYRVCVHCACYVCVWERSWQQRNRVKTIMAKIQTTVDWLYVKVIISAVISINWDHKMRSYGWVSSTISLVDSLLLGSPCYLLTRNSKYKPISTNYGLNMAFNLALRGDRSSEQDLLSGGNKVWAWRCHSPDCMGFQCWKWLLSHL